MVIHLMRIVAHSLLTGREGLREQALKGLRMVVDVPMNGCRGSFGWPLVWLRAFVLRMADDESEGDE